MADYGFGDAEKDLEEIKKYYMPGASMRQIIEVLELAVKHCEKGCMRATLKKYAAEFESSAFTDLASDALLAFLRAGAEGDHNDQSKTIYRHGS